jgi:hypothetical protein
MVVINAFSTKPTSNPTLDSRSRSGSRCSHRLNSSVTSMHRRLQFIHNNRQSGTCVPLMFAQVVDEAAASTPFFHLLAERGVKFDRTVEKESGDRLMLKRQAMRNACVTASAAALGRQSRTPS